MITLEGVLLGTIVGMLGCALFKLVLDTVEKRRRRPDAQEPPAFRLKLELAKGAQDYPANPEFDALFKHALEKAGWRAGARELSESEKAFSDEWSRFQAQLPKLIVSHGGRWLVFKDGAVVSDHDTDEDAFEAAIDRFGDGTPFIVAQAAKQNPATILHSW